MPAPIDGKKRNGFVGASAVRQARIHPDGAAVIARQAERQSVTRQPWRVSSIPTHGPRQALGVSDALAPSISVFIAECASSREWAPLYAHTNKE